LGLQVRMKRVMVAAAALLLLSPCSGEGAAPPTDGLDVLD
jgi:hypothetical protein